MDRILIKYGFDETLLSPKHSITTARQYAYAHNIVPKLNKTYGRLLVIGYDPDHTAVSEVINKNADKTKTCLCKCKCGNYIYVRATDLQINKIRSCGCWYDEQVSRITSSFYTKKHGDTGTRLYNLHWGMIRRCYNSAEISYPLYGGRGIKICDEWHTPENHTIGWLNFKNWAYNNGYYDQPNDTPKSELLSIERRDPNKNYCPENCLWIPLKMQSRNTNCTRYLHIFGKKISITEWAELCGELAASIETRLLNGWSEIDAATIPTRAIRLQFGYDTVTDKASYNGPRYNEFGELIDSNGFIRLIEKE